MKDIFETRALRTYAETQEIASSFENDLINLVDENLLVSWDDADALEELTREIENFLIERVSNESRVMPSNAINLVACIQKVLALAGYTYRLRLDISPDKAASLAMKAKD